MFKKLILIIFFLFISPSVFAANYTVSPSGSGSANGSDWDNTLSWGSVSFSRGNTYYLMEGTYSGKTFSTSTSGVSLIIIKKCGSGDGVCEDITGYTALEHDNVSTFTGEISFTSSYWVFDGQTGGGYGSWESGYGFHVHRTSGTDTKAVRIGANNITVAHANLQNTGEDQGSNKSDTIYSLGGNNITFKNCWIHDTSRTNLLISGPASNWLFEYNLISERHNQDAGVHGEHFSVNNTGTNVNHIYRYNIFRNSGGYNTGVVVIKDSTQSGFEIYGNLFYVTDSARYRVTNGVITDSTGDSTTNVKIYNNTILVHLNAISGNPAVTVSWDVSTSNEFKNNVVFSSGGIQGVATRSYNIYDSSALAGGETGGQYWSSGQAALFTAPGSYDYTLKQATNAGTNLSGTFTLDMTGAIFGDDGNWDRGAYEYQAGDTTSIKGVQIIP